MKNIGCCSPGFWPLAYLEEFFSAQKYTLGQKVADVNIKILMQRHGLRFFIDGSIEMV